MKTITVSLVFMVFIGCSAVAQQSKNPNVYLDALKLLDASFSNTGTGAPQNDYFFEVVKKYGLNRSNIVSNPFLKDFVPSVRHANNGSLTDDFKITPVEKTSAGSLSLQAALINGTANFMAGRFKEEVLSASIDYIFKAIVKNTEETKLTRGVFPKTYALIEELYTKHSYYSADLVYLKQVAQYDLNQLPDNLVLNLDAILPKLADKPDYKDLILAAHGIYKNTKKGNNTEKIITALAAVKYRDGGKVKNIFSLLDLVSQALIATKNSPNIWVSSDELPPVLEERNKSAQSIFFYGLLFEQLKTIPFIRPYLMEGGVYIDDTKVLSEKMYKLIVVSDKLNQAADYVKNKKAEIASVQDAIGYMKVIEEVIIEFNGEINSIKELGIVIPEEAITILSRYIDLAEPVMQRDYQRAIASMLIEFGKYTRVNEVYNKHLTFIAQLADVKSAADMEALMNAYALPIGSSSIKRQSTFNLSVNGYVGLTGGTEKAYGSFVNQSKANIGLTAPIGISSTFASGRLTAFVSLIDLGSVVNQRLNNDTTSYTDFKLEYFFTPGVGLFYNVPKIPVTAGIHWNYIPNLRTIKYETGAATITETNRSVSRFNVSVLVDIPFFTLFNRTKNE
ncbi:hypothetical protein SAMN04488511_102328 [Pedobacter suwonensis]|uniref:Outer membrane protein beta-barrel domain-containing protein n=1 Tax=Pedobacter suwonensis TaxID=332999 RepID=A0A1I0SPY1_9SPHI|nr:hypothetical protein [Pedobacter suwonensis]SFA41467.1 hypothetical protein SAMN04488511_102328 [Pedobacter suwonensis]